jgi:uncharacterized protein (TIGR02300 family)
MPKVDLGDKQTCPNCGAKFYDLRRRPAVCPKCATSFNPDDEAIRASRAKAKAAARPIEEEEEIVEDADDAETTNVEIDEDLIEADEEVATELGDPDADEPVITDTDEDETNPDKVPAGFSERAGDEIDSLGDEEDDGGVPLLEDDEFEEDEIDLGEDEQEPDDRD